jgi:D-alanyl-D-alanine carboxypeptidase (penicillin-binding protein 5/6)
MPARIVAALSAGCLTVVAGTSAAMAAPRTGSTEPVGGPLLGGKGVIVQPLTGAPALPPPSALPASSWLVANITTGQVLAAKDPHGKFLPASTLKTLTAVTLLPKLNPGRRVPVSYRDATVDGTRVGLVPSLKYTVAKLFTCMLIFSANDAADALADANGGIRKTVAEMNRKALQLQANDTYAMTPSGLDGPGESTSAYDLALLAQAGLHIPAFRHYIGIVRSRVPAPHHKHFMIYTHNQLLTTYRGDIGGKNGYTVAAQGTYVGIARRHGQTIVVTLLHAYPNFWPMARSLLNWGFHANGKVQPIGTLVKPLPSAAASTATAQQASAPVSAAAASTVQTHHRAISPSMELAAAAAMIALAVVVGLERRRRTRRRRYRPRLRLPPI